MKQKKSTQDFSAKNIIVSVLFGLVVCGVLWLPPLLFNEWQVRRSAQAAAQAEAAKELDRRGGVAEYIDPVNNGGFEGQEGFSLRNVTYYTYDSQGRRTAMDTYDANGQLTRYEHYTYDERGNRIREQSESLVASWESYEEVLLTYDEKNRLTLEQRFDGDVLSSEYYLRYPEDGNTYAVVQYYDRDGQKGSYYTTVFNGNEDPVAEYNYDAEGKVTSCEKYRYDEEGRQVYYICYNRGDEDTTPLREVFTEYEEDQIVRTSYEPLGHLNSVHYLVTGDNSRTEMYYLAGYSSGAWDEIHILGQDEPKWNRELKFWEGLWQTYDGDNRISSLNSNYDRLKSYYAYWYEDGRKVKELECSIDGGICSKALRTYVYNEKDLIAECYEYGFSRECLEEELQDGTRIRLEFNKKGSMLQRLLSTDAEGNTLRDIILDAEGIGGIEDWYEPLREQMWAEELIPTEDGILPADQVGGEEPEAGTEDGGEEPGAGTEDGGEEPEAGTEDGGEEPEAGTEDGGEESPEPPCDYVVEKGDSLWKIAGRVYGDPYRFAEIYRANKAVIGPDWNFIPEGMVLYLPELNAGGM